MNKENFEEILREKMYNDTEFTCEFYNDAQQELQIVTKFLDRNTLMQLVGECDRQKLDCYVSGENGKSVFVALAKGRSHAINNKNLRS